MRCRPAPITAAGAVRAALLVGLLTAACTSQGTQAAASHSAPSLGAPEPAIGSQPLTSTSPRLTGNGDPAMDQPIQRLRALAEGAAPAAAPPTDATGQKAPRRAARAPQRPSTAQRDAAWLMGLLSLHGVGMTQDAAQARHWFDIARQAGHPLAPAGLAWCDIDGCGGPPNPAAARPWISQLRAADPALALYLDWWVATRLAPLPVARPAQSPGATPTSESAPPHRALLARAARAGSAGALTELALENIAQGDTSAALEQLRTAAPRSPAAAANLQQLAARGPGDSVAAPPAQPTRATAVATRATAMQPADTTVDTPSRQSGEQLFQQAQRFHRGDGVPSNYSEAIRLYQQASASGSAPARRMLELVYSRPAPGGTVDISWMQQLARFDVSQSGALLSVLPAPSPQPFTRDPSPLYELLPPEWRSPPQR
ncbi:MULTISPECIES: hypothetical protein [unclassified Acidovorax]|uniref:SEL1-like repeat protein n=1 Tax=unclassified Acidovorax TaxID=2684926 RepID=UPI0028832353|nr:MULTISPECIES: hypothetical protein [unclassified Acidovorax]